MLRAILGETVDAAAQHDWQTDRIAVLETNLDDINSEILGHFVERALAAGALDVFHTPVQMKKDRPGTVVEVLCRSEDAAKLRDVLLRHSTTLGFRETEVTRHSLPRRVETIDTVYGSVKMKVAMLPDGTTKASPEHEDCIARATERGVTVAEVWLAATRAFS